MRNRLLMGLRFAAVSFVAVPAAAQIEVQRHRIQVRPAAATTPTTKASARAPARVNATAATARNTASSATTPTRTPAKATAAVTGTPTVTISAAATRAATTRAIAASASASSIQGGGSANEYGPYGYPERGYGAYAEWGYRNGNTARPLRAAFDFGRRDGYEAGFDAARVRPVRAVPAPLLPLDPRLGPPLRRSRRLRRELPQRVPDRLRAGLPRGSPPPLVSADSDGE